MGTRKMMLAILAALRKVPWQVWAGAALVVAFLAYGQMQHSRGYSKAEAKWQAAAQAEALRQQSINRAAQEHIARQHVEHLQQMQTLDKQIEELSVEAKRDPRAGSPSLGAGSLQRIDAIH